MTPSRLIAGQPVPAWVLAAFVLGAALTPWAYVAIGALRQFPPVFVWLSLPLLAASSAFLLPRLLRRGSGTPSRPSARFAEAWCWLLLAAFLFVVSKFTLMTAFERIGFLCLVWLNCSGLALGMLLAFFRRSHLVASRLARVPSRPALALSLLLLAASAAVGWAYVVTPPRFL